MNPEKLNTWLTLFANLGVVAGIIFLGIEIRQNNELLTVQASYSQFEIERERRSRIIENVNGFADVVEKQQNGEELTYVEGQRLLQHWLDVIDSWAWQFRENQAGRLEGEILNLADWQAQWRSYEGLRERYQLTISRRDESFIQFMEENVISQSF